MPKKFPGSSYHKVDLHIHTPQSLDYKDKDATADQIVEAAIAADLDAIAITDHNDYRFIDKVQAAANGTNLVVLPGVEVSTRNGHLLAIFDPHKSGNDIKNCLISCGLDDESSYGQEDTLCNKPIEDVAAIVKNKGGIAIAAHFDGKKGFKQAVEVGQARKIIFQHPAIEVLELVDTTKRGEWLEGRIYDKARACIQGSDAHSLDQVGSRPVWLRISDLTISALRIAFQDPKVRIRFPDEYAGVGPKSYIEELNISQGFFSGLKVAFNPGLNCFVGGQGVGKSALIEFIRFALDTCSEVPDIQDDHYGKLRDLLGVGGTVAVTIRSSDGFRYLVTRTFDDEDNPHHVERVTEDGSLEEYPLEGISKYFPILAYSQGEGMSIARDTIRQLELIDSHIDLSGQLSELRTLRGSLSENTKRLEILEKKLGDLPELRSRKTRLEQEVKRLEEQLARIEAVEAEPAVKDDPSWNEELDYLKGVTSGLEELHQEILQPFDDVSFHSIERNIPTTVLDNEAELNAIREIALEARKYIEKTKAQIDKDFTQLIQKIRTAPAPRKWTQKYKAHKQEYQEAMQRLNNVQVGALQSNLKKKQTELSRVAVQVDEETTQQSAKDQLLKAREKTLNQIEREKAIVTTKRQKQAEVMSSALKGRVQISVKQDGNSVSYQEWLESNLRNRTLNKPNLEILANCGLTPRELAKLLRQNDEGQIREKTGLSESVTSALATSFAENPNLGYRLEEIFLEDLPDIRMKRNDGEYKDISQLSTGQKFTVVILLALTDDDLPIVYDQPEDALDTAMIYSDIAQILRSSKDKRQFIFATHNSNMSVSADLDLAIVLESSATEAQVSGFGGLEDEKIKNHLITYFEGGTEAIHQRITKYGLPK